MFSKALANVSVRRSRPRALPVVALATLLLASLLAAQPAPANAQQAEPSLDDTSRLLGYLWGDAVREDGAWNMDRASGSSELVQTLVIQHGGTWIDRRQLIFTLPAPYDWDGWNSSIPNDDARTRAAVRRPNFLAAVLEGEGEIDGHIYDQKSRVRPFDENRLIGLHALLLERGFTTATITQLGDVDSGEVTIDESEFAKLRAGHEFVCPLAAGVVRVPGGEDYDSFGPIRWFTADGPYGDVVRTDCGTSEEVVASGTPVGDCVVTSNGNGDLRVSWSYKHGNIAVRRDGKFVEAMYSIDHFYVDSPQPGEHTYELRLTIDGIQHDDVSCGSGDTAAGVELAPTPGATCFDQVITHLGTGGNDVIDGTPGVDVIHGFGGNDLLRGFGQDDIICGGAGNDRIRGGYGNDTIDAGGGNDFVDAGAGADTVSGGFGDDKIFGRRGPDVLIGNNGDDILRAGDGFDSLFGGRGTDVLRGGKHIDSCSGGWGVDTLALDCETANQ